MWHLRFLSVATISNSHPFTLSDKWAVVNWIPYISEANDMHESLDVARCSVCIPGVISFLTQRRQANLKVHCTVLLPGIYADHPFGLLGSAKLLGRIICLNYLAVWTNVQKLEFASKRSSTEYAQSSSEKLLSSVSFTIWKWEQVFSVSLPVLCYWYAHSLYTLTICTPLSFVRATHGVLSFILGNLNCHRILQGPQYQFLNNLCR